MSVVGLKIMRNDIFLCIWHIILKLFLRILYPNIGHSVSPSLNNDSSPDSSESGDSRDTTYLKHITVDSEGSEKYHIYFRTLNKLLTFFAP